MESDLLALIERFEGCRLRPYLCPAGVPTIGIGSTRYLSGLAVSLLDPPISRERAQEIALHEARACIAAALRLSPCLAGDQRATVAIADFIYNLGAGAYAGSTLRRKINAGDRKAAREQIIKWCYAGGKVLRGLKTRREAEAALL